jgi:hypothetical protein
MGIGESTFFNPKAKYAGMTVSDARRLKAVEAESAKVKRLLADAELDMAAGNACARPATSGVDGDVLRLTIRIEQYQFVVIRKGIA